MSSYETLSEMDPAARAVAEVRAREAGMSLGQWLETLVYEHAASSVQRRKYFYGVEPAVQTETTGSSRSVAVMMHGQSAPHSDLGVYTPQLSFLEIETANLYRHFLSTDVKPAHWSALRMITAFPPRISHAAILLSAAFAEADVAFRLPPHRSSIRHRTADRWYHTLVDTCLLRSREVRNALLHQWRPSGRAEQMWGDAFVTLCDLTPARHELLVLFSHDRSRASIELAKYLDLATRQFELSANLITETEAPAELSEELKFASLRASLLERAGGSVSLTDGAKILGVTRQALHKRIKAGTALGMMDDGGIVLPRLQWVEAGKKVEILKGVPEIVKLFTHAGGWSALQFLLDPDPNLGEPPINALRAQRVDAAVSAAHAYLGLDEE